MYEPQSQQWRSQSTTGQIPSPVLNPCVVGVEGDNGTYEVRKALQDMSRRCLYQKFQVFLYGGANDLSVASTVNMGVVHVLSLPSFHWSRQEASLQFGRYLHSCALVGKRQMVVVGGAVVTKDAIISGTPWSAYVPDPWPNGIGIFDLSDMEWKASYDADAAAYTTPQIVKAHIERNGNSPAAWSDPTVEAWFTSKERRLFEHN